MCTDFVTISYAYIDPDGRFMRAKYGIDFNIIVDEYGYINATKLCSLSKENEEDVKKDFNQWKRLEHSKELINEVSADLGIPIADILYEVKSGSRHLTETRGTYVHPLLIPHIASWASPKFAIKVSKIVNDYFIKEALDEKEKIIKKKNKKISSLEELVREKLEKLDESLHELSLTRSELKETRDELKDTRMELKETNTNLVKMQKSNNLLLKKNDYIISKLTDISKNRIIPTGKSADQHLIVILKTNYEREKKSYEENSVGNYYGMRLMRKSLNSRLNEIKAIHPFVEIVEYIPCLESSMNIWHRIRDSIGKEGNKNRMIIKINNNYFDLLEKYDIEKFIEQIKTLYNDRLMDEDKIYNELKMIENQETEDEY